MKKYPNMLIVGAAGRNLGKTTFICRLIERMAKRHPVVGLKVTAFADIDGVIDVAAQQCKTYKTLRGRFMITLEQDATDPKDTGKMVKSGARPVYWLRTLKSTIAEGMQAVLEQMAADGFDVNSGCIICESNSARKAIDPGLFIIVRQEGDDFKPSCTEVYDEADHIILFYGDRWDIDPDDLEFSKARWLLSENISTTKQLG